MNIDKTACLVMSNTNKPCEKLAYHNVYLNNSSITYNKRVVAAGKNVGRCFPNIAKYGSFFNDNNEAHCAICHKTINQRETIEAALSEKYFLAQFHNTDCKLAKGQRALFERAPSYKGNEKQRSGYASEENIKPQEKYKTNMRQLPGLMEGTHILSNIEPEHSSQQFTRTHTRVLSFVEWPKSSYLNVHKMAGAGWVYSGEEDITTCFSCKGTTKNWRREDDPWEVHAKFFPACQYLKEQKGEEFIEKVGINKQVCTSTHSSQGIIENAPLSKIRIKPDAQVHYKRHTPNYNQTSVAIYPDRENINTRKSTYQHWPSYIDKMPKDMADAGWFYTGLNELTCCFQCGGSVDDWYCAEDPFKKHARLYPNCGFVMEKTSHYPVEGSYENPSSQQTGIFDRSEVNKNADNSVIAGEYKDILDTPSAQRLLTLSHGVTKTGLSSFGNELMTKASELRVKNKILRSSRQCKICTDNQSNIVFLPCMHLISCETCATLVKNCPECNQIVKGSFKTYLS